MKKESENADGIKQNNKREKVKGNMILKTILIAKSLIRRLQNNGPIIETQALYQWLMPHFSGVRLTVAVFIRISATIDTLFMHNSQIHVN
ncbi:hypothetical protein T05_5043 [Trichinella murrelli]|uniref:Uncharacterized protein n=1 Tax=Trichinella murrelli TaxID=144512 RepID=A0A0V0UB91_9BILA|nr:hypothetical protein T05_5043 [Trichinella murrelli]